MPTRFAEVLPTIKTGLFGRAKGGVQALYQQPAKREMP